MEQRIVRFEADGADTRLCQNAAVKRPITFAAGRDTVKLDRVRAEDDRAPADTVLDQQGRFVRSAAEHLSGRARDRGPGYGFDFDAWLVGGIGRGYIDVGVVLAQEPDAAQLL